MKTFSPLVQLFFLGLLGVLLAACGTFEVYVEQPEVSNPLALPATATPGSLSATFTSAPATTMPDAPDSAPTLTLAPFATPTLDLSLSPTPFPTQWLGANDSPMALVPAGPFVMGSNLGTVMAECDRLFDGEEGCLEEWFLDETPVHTVTLSAFYIDRYEVTNGQYAACVDAGFCSAPVHDYVHFTDERYADYPVVYVAWDDAVIYCTWREARLPTEAEWEKAARGTEGFLYPWGDFFNGNMANFCDSNCPLERANARYNDGFDREAPVGSFGVGASVWGVNDLNGNVAEWVADYYHASYYARPDAVSDPRGPAAGSFRVIRGNSWVTGAYAMRVTRRVWNAPTYADVNVGFRCALSP